MRHEWTGFACFFFTIVVIGSIFVMLVISRGVRHVLRLMAKAGTPDPDIPSVQAAPDLLRPPAKALICSFVRCKAINPQQARYCRRCGRHLQKSASIVRERITA
jgi:hypothetical protein